MEEFCKNLNIPFEKKELTLSDAISLDVPLPSPLPLPDLPSHMLRRIMLLDVSSRILPKFANDLQNPSLQVADEKPLSNFLDEDDDDGIVHPMDVFLYLFLKSQPTFRQILINQVSKCQLSLPLITYESDSGQVTFNHFAFQTLILNRYIDGEDSKAFSAVEEALPIVSFMRVGDCENSQKSDFLNRILKINHDYFFHKDCQGNAKKRYFLNGTVEIAWYLTNAKENNIINHHCIMLNLRGNACNFMKQRQFLGEISNVVYIFVPFSELTQDMTQMLVKSHDSFKGRVIFLIYKGSSNKNPSPEGILDILNDKDKTIGLKKKNVFQNQEFIEISITQILTENKLTPITLTDCIETATRLGILCDSLNTEIESAQIVFSKIPDSIQDNFSSETSLGDLKKQLLPLQVKFGDWAQANREMQQSGNRGAFEEYNRNVDDEQLKARASQIDLLSKPTILLYEIIDQCKKFSLDIDKYQNQFFLFWELLKIYLNGLSRSHLPILYTEYKRWLVESYSVHPSSGGTDERDALQKNAKAKLLNAAMSLTQSSFGIEHIFREIGQTFEAFIAIHNQRKIILLENQLDYRPTLLPSVMAHLILKGHSFEIVNGDVNHVPLQWVSEVLNSLSDLIGADKKIFVISVLGIQSSGKSTLLNTMFGISFPVSSGRCTRGVFMQMIEVKHSLREELGYDYLVVLDTEGLRAPELSGSLSYKRDNEMATFTVGLGDISLINIKGESHSEVQDILEITVIAFIRMQLSFSKPKCFFVHQNVGDIQAKTNLIVARKNLIDTLNEMTSCAAQQENKEIKFSQFCDVIEFNPEEDVFYFPGLFEGEPPVTSISPGYVQSAEMLRDKLIACCSKERSFLNIKLWKKKISSLWNSVLNENFVFSYRNILELNCRVELDIRLCSWYSYFAQEMASIKSECFNQLYNVETSQIQEKLKIILDDLFEITQSLSSDTENSIMDYYFIKHEKKECFQQWNYQTKRYFKSCRDREYRKAKEECDTISRVEKQKQNIDKNFAICRKDIVSKVRKLYENNEKNDSFGSEESVQIYFDEIWNELKSNVQLPNMEEVDISRDLQQVLIEIPHLQQLDVISVKKTIISDISKYEIFGMGEFEDMIQIYGEVNTDYTYYEIIDVQKRQFALGEKVIKIFHYLYPFKKEKNSNNPVTQKMKLIFENLDSQMNDVINRFPQNSNYCIDYFRVLIDECVKLIAEQNKTEKTNARQSLVLTNNFIFDFVFYQCCKAIQKFKSLHETYLKQNCLEIKLFELKTILKHSFTQHCEGIRSEDLCAQLLMEITIDGMKRFLEDTILQLLLDRFKNDPEHSSNYNSRASLQQS